MVGPRPIAGTMHLALAVVLAACDCGRSHGRPVDAAPEADAPVTFDALADAPRYETALACDDPAIGRPIAAGEDVLIGESGFQRPPLDAGPSTVLSEDLFGGAIVSAIVDDYDGRWRFAVGQDDGTYAIYATDPSFEGCD